MPTKSPNAINGKAGHPAQMAGHAAAQYPFPHGRSATLLPASHWHQQIRLPFAWPVLPRQPPTLAFLAGPLQSFQRLQARGLPIRGQPRRRFMDFGTAITGATLTIKPARHVSTRNVLPAPALFVPPPASPDQVQRKRRIQLPGLSSVKLRHTLWAWSTKRLKFLNGQWVISIKMWQPPKPEQKPESRIAHGAVDTGINPHATDSEGQVWGTRAYSKPNTSSAAGNGPKPAALPGAAAGGKLNDASTISTVASEVYAATPSIK